jgi:hypothetical protein
MLIVGFDLLSPHTRHHCHHPPLSSSLSLIVTHTARPCRSTSIVHPSSPLPRRSCPSGPFAPWGRPWPSSSSSSSSMTLSLTTMRPKTSAPSSPSLRRRRRSCGRRRGDGRTVSTCRTVHSCHPQLPCQRPSMGRNDACCPRRRPPRCTAD